MEPVKLCIVGIDKYIDTLIELLHKSDRMDVVGICSTKLDLTEEYSARYCDIAFFNDPREMFLAQNPNLLFFWEGGFKRDFIQFAMEKGSFVVLRPPLKGTIKYYLDLIKLAEKYRVGIYVWSPWYLIPAYESVGDWLEEKQIRAIWFRTQRSFTESELRLTEASELISASVYPNMYLLQRWLGLPIYVYCREHYFSADSADQVIQFFSEIFLGYRNASASILASINAGPIEEKVLISTMEYQIHASINDAKLYNSSGKLVEESKHYDTPTAHKISYRRYLDNLWQCFIEKRRITDFHLRNHIGTLLALEAAQVSARTNQPEQVSKVAEVNEVLSLPLTM